VGPGKHHSACMCFQAREGRAQEIWGYKSMLKAFTNSLGQNKEAALGVDSQDMTQLKLS
jgi:hypothetical protein